MYTISIAMNWPIFQDSNRYVANCDVGGSQCTIVRYIDDLKISHKRKTVVEDILKELENKLKVKLEATYGDTNGYLGM